jgi:3-deoxy-D-manno-octulosonic acid kinase
MHLIEERFISLPRGGIVYDGTRVRHPDLQMFKPSYWAGRNSLVEVAGGRQSVYFLRAEGEQWVLRHYRRGGLAASVSNDRYLWFGAAQTRCVREWRLLADLYQRGLPVPAPVAAAYERSGLTYRADLITRALPASRTLADAITGGELVESQWRRIGATIARFHAQGVQHADLNAHNVLLTADGGIYILDFDRGRLRARGAWEEAAIQRLGRSLQKIQRQRANVRFGQREWAWLLAGVVDPAALATQQKE